MKKREYTVEEFLEVLSIKLQKMKHVNVLWQAAYDIVSSQKEEIEQLKNQIPDCRQTNGGKLK